MYLKKKKLRISKDYRCKQLLNILENEIIKDSDYLIVDFILSIVHRFL